MALFLALADSTPPANALPGGAVLLAALFVGLLDLPSGSAARLLMSLLG